MSGLPDITKVSSGDLIAHVREMQERYAPRRENRALTLQFAKTAALLLTSNNIEPRSFTEQVREPITEILKRPFRKPREITVGTKVVERTVARGWTIDTVLSHSTDLTHTRESLILTPDGSLGTVTQSGALGVVFGYQLGDTITEYPDSSPFPREAYDKKSPLYDMDEASREQDVRSKLVAIVEGHDIDTSSFPAESSETSDES